MRWNVEKGTRQRSKTLNYSTVEKKASRNVYIYIYISYIYICMYAVINERDLKLFSVQQ